MDRSEILRRIEEAGIEGGEGSGSWTLLKEARIPTSREAEDLDYYGVPFDVDPEIRPLVIHLNKLGYSTRGSCAGHRDSGFITFESSLPKKDKLAILELVREFGLKDVRGKTGDWYSVTFRPVGRTLD